MQQKTSGPEGNHDIIIFGTTAVLGAIPGD